MRLNPKYSTRSQKVIANQSTVRKRCLTTVESAFTTGSVFPEFVMMRQEFAREDKWESHALIMLNAIRLSHADHQSYGHLRLYACQWLMLVLCVRLITIANQETFAGR